MKPKTREEIIKELIKRELFTDSEIGSDAMELFIKYWEMYDEYLIDYAEKFMNLFGFDIGMDNVIKIDRYFTDNEDKIGYWEILDLSIEDMKFMKHVCRIIGINLDFSHWIEEYNKSRLNFY